MFVFSQHVFVVNMFIYNCICYKQYSKIHSGTVSLDKDKYLTRLQTLEVPGHLTNFSTPDTLFIVKP